MNATGEGEASDASNATAPADETLTVTAHATDNAKATLAIGNHSRDWYYKADTAPYAACSAVVSSGTTSASLSDLSSNTSYTFKAYSDSSCTTANELAVASALLTKPGKPATPTVEAGSGSGQLTLSSSVSGSGAISKWQYQQKASSDNNFSDWQDISSTSTTLSYTVTGLTDNTNYQFQVRAVNATGDGVTSDRSTSTAPTTSTASATSAVAALNATSIEAETATLSIVNHSSAWHYKYTAPRLAITCTEVSAGTTTAGLTGLTAGTEYSLKAYVDQIDCQNNTEAKELGTVTFLTKPAQTTGVAVTVAPNNSTDLAVSWTAVQSATSYKVQWKLNSEQWGANNQEATVTSGTTYTIANLTNRSSYTIRVAAVNGTGTGGWSTEEPVAPDKDVTLSETELKLLEDTGSDTYTVVLTAAPTADVTVTPAVANKNSTDTNTYATVSGSLTFTTSNWQTPQTVTVTANDNDDTTFNTSARTLTVSHSVSGNGSGYESVTASDVTVKMQDDDLPNADDPNDSSTIELDLSQNTPESKILNLRMTENAGTFTYKIKLNSDPGDNTTTIITPCSTNESVLQVTSGQLTFMGGSSGNWNTGKKVTISIVGKGEAEIVHWINVGCETASQALGANASSRPPQVASFKIVAEVKAAAVENMRPTLGVEDQTAIEGNEFGYEVSEAKDDNDDEAQLTYTAFVLQAEGVRTPLPSWLTF